MGQKNAAMTLEERGRQLSGFKDDIYTNVGDQTSFILNETKDTLDMILSMLDLESLVCFSATCKSAHIYVMDFIKHECSAAGLQQAFTRFSSSNGNLLTPVEKRKINIHSTDSIDVSKSVEDLTSRERRLLWWLAREKSLFNQPTYRISVADDRVDFAHKGTYHIPIEEDDELGRPITKVDNVCWLNFLATFENVEPGRYVVSVVLKVLRESRMPHAENQKTEWILGQATVNPRTGKKFWDELKEGRTPIAELCDGLKIEKVDDKVDGESWVSVSLPEIRLAQQGSVVFELRDFQCPWWKSGILFDFVQLRKTGN